ncbi:MAG TPA: DJ-1/PfpI family protein [Paraburkholderia sp.]|jgi:protease I|nr:DJ-1/PfpI family protein [Paraburkholderia sp.]
MKRIAVVIPPDKFRDEELFIPLQAWKQADIQTTLFSTVLTEVTGDVGGKATPDALLDSLQPQQYDAIAVIGGTGTVTHLWANQKLRDILLEFERARKPVTAICAGSVTLARAGLLTGKPATTYPAEPMIAELKAHGARYSSDHALTSGSIVTGDGPDGAQQYADQVIRVLETR